MKNIVKNIKKLYLDSKKNRGWTLLEYIVGAAMVIAVMKAIRPELVKAYKKAIKIYFKF